MRTRYIIRSYIVQCYISLEEGLLFIIYLQRLLDKSASSFNSTDLDREVAVELNIVEVLRRDVATSDNAIELRSIEIHPDKTNVRYYYIIVMI